MKNIRMPVETVITGEQYFYPRVYKPHLMPQPFMSQNRARVKVRPKKIQLYKKRGPRRQDHMAKIFESQLQQIRDLDVQYFSNSESSIISDESGIEMRFYSNKPSNGLIYEPVQYFEAVMEQFYTLSVAFNRVRAAQGDWLERIIIECLKIFKVTKQ